MTLRRWRPKQRTRVCPLRSADILTFNKVLIGVLVSGHKMTKIF